ncbi:hypothetical protein K8I28_12805 [bacterium]|nr:hypothetical protein [bacterium]
MDNTVEHHLKERIKELNLLHNTAKILQDHKKSVEEVCTELVCYLPPAWQYPEITAARIIVNDQKYVSPNFAITRWCQSSSIFVENREIGVVEVFYLEERPESVEGPFLAEERALINSFTEMLKYFIQHRMDDAALENAKNSLEKRVNEQTQNLREINVNLRTEIEEHLHTKEKLQSYQQQLQQLALQVSLIEERERREIASDLHDHLGQALAFVKKKMLGFRGENIFSGHNSTLDEIITLLNQAINYTRTLTFELSPPVLYELGLESAIEWLSEQFESKHEVKIKLKFKGILPTFSDEVKVLIFKSVRELLLNAIKHSGVKSFRVSSISYANSLRISIDDSGKGFSLVNDLEYDADKMQFGLFSIRERLLHLGGQLEIITSPGNGCKATMVLPNKEG